jgi:phosphonoacetaldehyde hydrolase
MRPLIAKAYAQGFDPDWIVCCDDVARSRPDPMGMHACMNAMGLSQQGGLIVKVDDTAPGLSEGLNAGCWTVGVAASGNAMGWSLAQWRDAEPRQRQMALACARRSLLEAGAHEVIDTVADLPSAIATLNERIRIGERP